MPQAYLELTRLIERLHRRFLDVLRAELVRLDIHDINAVQALLLANIGDEEVNVRELMNRGYYMGSNASYNLKKLVENDYLIQEKSERDRRATLIRLSPKGSELAQKISELEASHGELLLRSDPPVDIEATRQCLRQLERIWTELIRYGS